jgi:hypothetical protein
MKNEYEISKLNELETKIAKLSQEANYLKAWLYLDNLANTQKTILVDYLAAHYGVGEVNSFDEKAFVDCKNFTARVKSAITIYKSKTDTKANPSWAKEALKMAKIADDNKDYWREN